MKKIFLAFTLAVSNLAAFCVYTVPHLPRNTASVVSLKNGTTEPQSLFITLQRTYADGSESSLILHTKELLPGEREIVSLVDEEITTNPLISSIVTTVGYKGCYQDFSQENFYRSFIITENEVIGIDFKNWYFCSRSE